MPYTQEQIEELDVLLHYNLETTLEGIKVHKSARPELIAAVKRLYEKGLITQVDGGYLTEIGHEAAEHAQALLLMLAEPQNMTS